MLAQTTVLLNQTCWVWLRPFHYLAWYSYLAWKCSLPLFQCFIALDICLLFSNQMLAVLVLGCLFQALLAVMWQHLLCSLLLWLQLLLLWLLLWMLACSPASCFVWLPFNKSVIFCCLVSCVRLLAFYFWHHLMLLSVKVDNTTDSFCLCCLLCVLPIIIKSGLICTSVHLHTIIMCTDGMAVYTCPCLLLPTWVVTAVCLYMLLLQSYG